MKIRKAVFPVAGLGTRFLPATKIMPKEMLPVVDKPLIQYSVEEAKAAGIEEMVFVISKGKEMLVDHFDRASELEQQLKSKGKNDLLDTVHKTIFESGTIVSVKQNEALGLGHAIWCAREVIGNEPFAVLLPDDLVQANPPVLCQMVELFERLQSSMVAIMEVAQEDISKYGILDADTIGDRLFRIKNMIEKPKASEAPSNLAIIGRYIFTPEIFHYLNQKKIGAGGEIQITDAMVMLLAQQPVHGYQFQGVRYDCGDKTGFQMANFAFSLANPDMRTKLVPFAQQILSEVNR
ncbi:MAG: UTP--glucose-1-phosphate uridylyltransferase GalU [Desulfobacterales bacterium]|nr:UTP--glucose-1-phosphate uridylyltransferase GalU [Desulfobacterales bacterium]